MNWKYILQVLAKFILAVTAGYGGSVIHGSLLCVFMVLYCACGWPLGQSLFICSDIAY